MEAPKKLEPKITFQYEYHNNEPSSSLKYHNNEPISSLKYHNNDASSSLRYQSDYESQYQLQNYQPRKYQPPQPYQSEGSFQYQTPQYIPSDYQKSYNSIPYRTPAPVSEYRPISKPQSHYNNQLTTPAPKRFYPPGKLDFNRTPDGFSYSFSKT